jgi:hypothetical protein
MMRREDGIEPARATSPAAVVEDIGTTTVVIGGMMTTGGMIVGIGGMTGGKNAVTGGIIAEMITAITTANPALTARGGTTRPIDPARRAPSTVIAAMIAAVSGRLEKQRRELPDLSRFQNALRLATIFRLSIGAMKATESWKTKKRS